MNADDNQKLEALVIKKLQSGAKPPAVIAHAFNRQHRPPPVTEEDRDARLDAEDVVPILNRMVMDGVLTQLDEPAGWYQLTDWCERPLCVLSVSQHTIKIGGMSQQEALWLDESIRAARHEHEIKMSSLQGWPADDDRCTYLINTRCYEILEQYRETLRQLADETHTSNPEKAGIYARLAEATDIEDQWDSREREVPLRG